MFTFLRNNPQSVLANYQGMQARLDMTAFVDYLILNIYTCTGDWPHNNWIAARAFHNRQVPVLVWDAEGAFGSFGLSRDEQQLRDPATEQRRARNAELAL